MTLQVRYFASLREALGSGEAVTLPAGSRVADLRAALVARSPAHAERLGPGCAVRCAVAQQMCTDDQAALADGAEVAFFPPVTGG
ncbi:MoaD/ThiS family protein [Aquincola agrisoli]|uniref:MoaD/ThiS family protein n=1 Tax=Aquincola TaxID=391952 RepID=UPI003608B1AA